MKNTITIDVRLALRYEENERGGPSAGVVAIGALRQLFGEEARMVVLAIVTSLPGQSSDKIAVEITPLDWKHVSMKER